MNGIEESIYFFDTSALVKRYHREVGTDIIDDAFAQESAMNVMSDISVIELYSAFTKKIRLGEITKGDFRAAIKTLLADIQRGTIHLVAFEDKDKKGAAALIERYGPSRGLRTLDAIQLAVLNKLGPEIVDRVYCADRQFIAVIEMEGFSIVDPEQVSENPA
ncbi:MAG: type II toxin-antitoxin system VapC family toxin [Chloroflexota bacterium]